MPKEKKCIKDLRHNEYYKMQEIIDTLFKESSQNSQFEELMSIILSEENIMLAYRNIKSNNGSYTPGTDGKTLKDIEKMSPEEVVKNVRYFLIGSKHGYRPKPVRRKYIPKPNGELRPLGIPCIWDRLIQQCIKQILEPICEAKFSVNSHGFRPSRNIEHAIHRTYQILQIMNLHYVVEFDIKGFFDNVNHQKLIKQIWALGIHDKTLIYVLKKILKTPIKEEDNTITLPEKGTPQGGIISPLLSNIVLNELDQWIDSQWEENINVYKWKVYTKNSGGTAKYGYEPLRKTNLKEMHIVRYADDFRIFCKDEESANKIKIAVTKWISERLKLELNEDKTKIINTKERYMRFLGFKIKVHQKGKKYTVISHVDDKQLSRMKKDLKNQIKNIARPKDKANRAQEVIKYNSMVMGMQNYFKLATEVSNDFRELNRIVIITMKNQLDGKQRNLLKKSGRKLTVAEQKRYGKSKMMRYIAGIDQPIYPIGYVKHQKPIGRKRGACMYTREGREKIHDTLTINTKLMHDLMKSNSKNESIEFNDNKISLFSAQFGKCGISNKVFENTNEIHCHHIIPKSQNGTDKYDNLILVTKDVHILIHAQKETTIQQYLDKLNLSNKQKEKLNQYRKLVGNREI